MVAAGRHKVCAVSAESAVPHPALVASQCSLERECARLGVGTGRFHLLDLPNLCSVVGAASGQLLDVGREKNTGDALLVCRKVSHGYQLGALKSLDKLPNVDIALREQSDFAVKQNKRDRKHTLLLAAQSRVPSVATVTLVTETSSSGMSWCAQVFSAKSQSRMLPPLSQLIISPWFGWITTSLTGDPWL